MNFAKKFGRVLEISPEEWLYFAKSRLAGSKKLHEVADETIEVSPATERYVPPGIFFERHLDNIVSFHHEGIDEEQMFRIRGGHAKQPATLAFKVSNVVLNSPGITSGLWRGRFPSSPVKSKVPWTGGDEAAFSASFYTVKYFGHWVKEECVTRVMADDFAPALSVRTAQWKDKEFFGRILDQDWTTTDTARLKTAYFFFDDGHTQSRVSRVRALRQRFRERFASDGGSRVFYLKRAPGGLNPRAIVNEEEVLAAMEKAGIKIVDQAKLSSEECLREITGSSVMVTIEGSHQALAYYALSDTPGLVMITPPNLFNTYAKNHFDVYGCPYGFVVGEAREGGFHVDIDDLLAIIEQVDAAASTGAYKKYAFE
jgi:hypothetical protein